MASGPEDRKKTPERKLSEKEAKKEIEKIETRIVPVEHELLALDRQRPSLYKRRDNRRAQLDDARTSFISRVQSAFSPVKAELDAIEAEIGSLHTEIQKKARAMLSGLTQRDNIVFEFLRNDPKYRQAEVLQGSLSKVKGAAAFFQKSIHVAQEKVEGALTAGANEEALKVGTDVHLETEAYNKKVAHALKILKLSSAAFHIALREYGASLEKVPEWHIDVAIDKESILSVNLLSTPHFADVYTPAALETLRVQLGALNAGMKTIVEQITESDGDLQRQKNAYEDDMRTSLSGFHFNDREFYEELARGSFEKEEEKQDQGTESAPSDDMIE